MLCSNIEDLRKGQEILYNEGVFSPFPLLFLHSRKKFSIFESSVRAFKNPYSLAPPQHN